MDVSLLDLSANSSKEDLELFWAEVDVILSLPDDIWPTDGSDSIPIRPVDVILLNERLSSFFSHCVEFYETHLEQSANGDNALTRLVESPLFTHSSIQNAVDVLVKLIIEARSLPTLHLLFDTILLLGRKRSDLYRSKLIATQLIPRLVHHIWAARYAEEFIIKDSGDREGNGQEGGWSLDWNVKYVRAKSMGNPDKQIEEARDRILQCRLREESVVLLYEVCRAQRLEGKEMRAIDAAFVDHLFDLVEASRHWHDDSYNFQLIKLIVALNEQFMVSGIETATGLQKNGSNSHSRKTSATHSNVVMTVLRFRLNASNTFGENIIWMLNRASSLNAEDVCMQLLVLKLLYLLFTTKETAHYFYLNDLKVLVDVFIRELSDLPEESESLRNTYLRVLHPLLTNTQLLTYPYKRNEIRRLLQRLTSHAHLRDISSTTKRLVDRCLNGQWCVDLDAMQNTSDATGSKRGQDDDQKHTLAVQSISGGPSTLVQTKMTIDSEGVTIPMTSMEEPFQGAPSSTISRLAVAVATITSTDVDQANLSTKVTDTLQSNGITSRPSLRVRARGSSVGAKSPRRSECELPSLEGGAATGDLHQNNQTGNGDLSTRREASASSASTLSVRRDLGQRAASARTAPVSPPLSTRNSSKEVYRLSQDVDTDDETTSRWSDGSGSNSWQLGMAGDERPSSSIRSASLREALVRHGSPLSTDSTEHFYNLASVQWPEEKVNKALPIVQIEDIIDNKSSSRRPSFNGTSTGGIHQGTRRRPPAPPKADGGLASRKEKKFHLSSSTSESHLPLSIAIATKGDNFHNKITKDLSSMPSSPLLEVSPSSREPSPTMESQASFRRRRPPPPPVNRSTKVSRTPNHSSQLTDAAPRRTSRESNNNQSIYTNDESANTRHVERAMDHLYVADTGYGW